MAPITRRAALGIVTSAPFAAALVWTPAEARQAHEHADAARAQAAKRAAPFKPKFFTAHEYATVDACSSTSSSRATSGPAAPPRRACRSSWTS